MGVLLSVLCASSHGINDLGILLHHFICIFTLDYWCGEFYYPFCKTKKDPGLLTWGVLLHHFVCIFNNNFILHHFVCFSTGLLTSGVLLHHFVTFLLGIIVLGGFTAPFCMHVYTGLLPWGVLLHHLRHHCGWILTRGYWRGGFTAPFSMFYLIALLTWGVKSYCTILSLFYMRLLTWVVLLHRCVCIFTQAFWPRGFHCTLLYSFLHGIIHLGGFTTRFCMHFYTFLRAGLFDCT